MARKAEKKTKEKRSQRVRMLGALTNRTGLLRVYHPGALDPLLPVSIRKQDELGPEGPALPVE